MVLFVSQAAQAELISGSVRHAETDAPLSGFIVKDPGNTEAVVGSDGSFSIDIPNGDTQLSVFSSNNVLFSKGKPSVNGGKFLIQPTGVVYNASTGKAVSGVKVVLRRDTAFKTKIKKEQLGEGQYDQVTDKHGLYRFDLVGFDGGSGVVLEVDTAGTSYKFPSSTIPPPEPCPQTLTQVSPDVQTSPAYCLGFSVPAGNSTLPIHNHLPVDGSGDSLEPVTIQHLASKTQASTGDVITYTIRVQNNGTTSYDKAVNGISVRAGMSKGLRFLSGSAKASLDGEAQTLIQDEGSSSVSFGSAASKLSLPAGSELLIRYQAVVDAQLREDGVLSSRAKVMDSNGDELSKVAKVDVRFSQDPIFGRSLILGRVFCDGNGNGWADETDKGVYGAHVYIDTGRYAITDRNGFYHLSDVPAGLHVVKIDDNTVAPGSISLGPVSRSQQVNPGMSYRISFGFRCNTEQVGPTEVETVDTEAPVNMPDVVVVTGTISAMDVLVDGERSAADGTVALGVVGVGKDDGPLDLDWHTKSKGSPIQFDIQVPKGSQQSRLWIEMRSEAGLWVAQRVMHKAGALGPRVEWDRTDDDGKRIDNIGTLYRARLEAVDGVGGRWHAQPVYFTVGAKRSGPVFRSVIDGSPLTRRKNLNRATKRLVRDLVKKSRQIEGPQVLLRLGVGIGTNTSQLTDVETWAVRIIQAMTARGHLNTKQIGTRFEVGITGIVVEIYDPLKPAADRIDIPQNPPHTPRVLVAGKAATLDKSGRFVSVLNKSEGNVAAVEWTNKDGVHREVLIRLSDDHGIPKSRLIRTNLDKQEIVVGETSIDLSPLALEVDLPYAVGRVDAGIPAEPISFTIKIASGSFSEWKLNVIGPDGTEAFSANGTGDPPAQIPWLNPTKMAPGDYIIQMVGTTVGGANIQSARLLMLMLEGSDSRAEGTLLEKISGALFTKRQKLTLRLRNRLKRIAKTLKKRDPEERFVVEVHWDGTGDDKVALTATSNEATRVKNKLLLNGVEEDVFQVIGIGNRRVLSDPKSSAGRRENRRIEIRISDSDSGKPLQRWTVHVDDKPVPLTKKGFGTGRLGGEPGSQSTVRVVSPDKNALEQTVMVEASPDPLEEDEKKDLPFGIPKLSRSLDYQARTGKPAPPLAVSTLQVELPPDGSELGHPVLPIVGRAPIVDGLQVRINGQVVPVEEGHFRLLLPLAESGESKVVVEARDAAGNVARIRRTYRVKGNALFLLALADGALTQTTTRLPGVGSSTSIRIKNAPVVNDLYLHGRGALYLKARIRGSDLLKTVHITAYADSARKREGQAFVEQVIDPKQHYPVYGDQATEISDVHTRGKYYVAVEADPGKIIVGSFRAGEWGVEMLRYGRIMEGAQLDLKKAFVEGYDTVIKGFVSTSERRTRRGQVTLRGTGGSYYFLPHRDVIEGTEKVSISIRDRDTGAILKIIPQVPDLDYRIDYIHGNLTFRKPVPSHATGSFMLGAADGLSGKLGLQGHSIFIRVDYETRDPGHAGEMAWGVYGRQTISGMASLGGGYLREGNQSKAGPDYELWGTDAKMWWGRTMRLSAELAHSQSTIGSHQLSEDGGLSYRSLGAVAGGRQKGWGLSIRTEGDLGEWLRPDKNKPFLIVRGRYRRQDSGFSSSHNVLERGSEHGGGEVEWHLNRNQKLTVRHDTMHTDRVDSPVDQPLGRFTRMLSTTQYQHRIGRYTVVGEVLHAFEDDTSLSGHTGHRGAASSMLQYRVNPRLSLFLEQQGHVGGSDEIFRSSMDRAVTSFGADVSIASDLWVSVGESVRWSGEDTAMVGFRTKMSEQSELYAEHRLHSPRDSERRVPEMVVGSEERWGPDQSGRSYAEYKTGQANSTLYSRAVAGIGRSYKLTRGLTADVAYERSHQTRVNEVGTDGDSNTLSVGVAYLANKNLSFTTRFETRYETLGHDRLQLVTLNRLLARLTPTTEFIARANMAVTQDLNRDAREAETMELNVGLAYRPLGDDFSLLLRAARIVDMRPVSLEEDSGSTRSTSDVFSIEPVVSLPWGFSFGPKVAYKHTLEEAEGLKAVHSHTVLGALRLAFRLWRIVDLAGEYRWFYVNLAEQMEHGTLVELAAHITRYARIGVGYNFSHFDDNLFDVMGGNTHGFFVRLTGIY